VSRLERERWRADAKSVRAGSEAHLRRAAALKQGI
jgi:hypothetical protein